MKNFLSILTLAFFAATASAAVERKFRDLKLPTQQMVEKETITNPAAASTDTALNDHAGATSAAVATASTFLAQPDVPRNVVITPGGTTGDVESCNVTVSGTNVAGKAITDVLAFAANASTATVGVKAFKTVSSVSWAANCESGSFGATWDMGYGEKLGLSKCLAAAGHVLFSTVSGVYESTRATVVADADEKEKNTADFNGTMDGSADFEIFFFQNFSAACQ